MFKITTRAERCAAAADVIKHEIAFLTALPEDSIELLAPLASLGLDELDMSDLLMGIEDELQIEFESRYYENPDLFVTAQNVLDEVTRLLS